MNNYRKGLYAAVFSALFAGGAAPAFAAGFNEAAAVSAAPISSEARLSQAVASVVLSQPLNDVVVTGSSNAFLRSDQRLALLSASLPLDAKAGPAQPSDLQRVAALFPQSPDAATGEARRMMSRGQTPPDGVDPDGEITLGTR